MQGLSLAIPRPQFNFPALCLHCLILFLCPNNIDCVNSRVSLERLFFYWSKRPVVIQKSLQFLNDSVDFGMVPLLPFSVFLSIAVIACWDYVLCNIAATVFKSSDMIYHSEFVYFTVGTFFFKVLKNTDPLGESQSIFYSSFSPTISARFYTLIFMKVINHGSLSLLLLTEKYFVRYVRI